MDKQTQENLLKIVKDNYEDIASDFNETRKKYLWPELIKLASVVKNGDSILDAGCGNGRLLEAFKGKEINYIGVDGSEKLIELAKIRNKIPASSAGRQETRNKFIVGDLLELDKLPENNFDFVFCIAVLHHLPGSDLRVQALKQMKEKIKADGKIIITVWNLWSQPKFRKLIFKFWFLKLFGKIGLMSRRYGRDPESALQASGDLGDILFNWKNNRGEIISQRYYHAFTKCELKKNIKKAGLNIEKIYKDKYNYYAILRK